MGSINSRPLKAFVRFDGSGRIVAGSLILRKNKPKVGKWKEIQAYECCVPTTTLSPRYVYYEVGSPVSMAYPSVTIQCDESTVAYQYVNSAGPYTSVDAIVTALNSNPSTSALGTFFNDGGGVIGLSMPATVSNELCSTGSITMIIQPD
jgi:hypothetical protein